MRKSVKQLLFWLPRLMTFLFAVFLSLFALDVFGERHTFWELMLALLIHLIPTGLVLLALALAWRWPWLGGILFPGLGLLYLAMARGEHWTAYLVIAGPLFLVGILFSINWVYRAEIHPASGLPDKIQA